MTENCNSSETSEVVMKAIASLATRVAALEKEGPVESKNSPSKTTTLHYIMLN